MNLTDPSVRAAWRRYERTNRYCHDIYLAEQEGTLSKLDDIGTVCPECGRLVTERGRWDCTGVCRAMAQTYSRERKHR